MAKRIRPSDEVVQKNIKEWNIPQPDRDYMVVIHCSTYNHGKYIKDALEGFVNQKCSCSFCAIIIDDGSSDNAPAIIREYAEQYPEIIKPILLGENHMQHGILREPYFEQWHWCAKYIAFCEGDDYWIDSLKLQKQVSFMEEHPDFSMCIHGADVKNESSREVWAKCETIETREYFSKDVFPDWVVPTASIVYRREIVDAYPFKHYDWVIAGDIVLILKGMHTGRVWGMAEHMSVYRMNNGSLMASLYNETVESRTAMCRHYQALMMNFPQVDKDYCNHYIASFNYSRFRLENKWSKKLEHLYVAIQASPQYVLKKFLRIR